MKRSIGIIFIFFFSRQLNSQLLFSLRNDSIRAYKYAGGDEFNSAKIDESSWGLYLWPKTNMAQNFAYNPNNTRIEDGVAIFTLNQKDSTYVINSTEVDSNFIRNQHLQLNDHKFYLKYAAGSIISKQKYHYGFYELRFKIEKGKGVWPAFWFFGGNKNEEIDVFELKGERGNEIHVDTHCPYGCDKGYKTKLGLKTNWGDWMPVANYLHEGFNLMLLDWREKEIIWYINGFPLAYFKGAFPNPMNMFINTQVASKFSAFQPGPDESTVCPNEFYVDYVRQWKPVEKNDAPILNIVPEFTISNRFSSDYFNQSERQHGLMYNKKKFNNEQGLISLIRIKENIILINVIGLMNNPNTVIELKGQYGHYRMKQLGIEREITIDSREKDLDLVITLNEKTYTQHFSLN